MFNPIKLLALVSTKAGGLGRAHRRTMVGRVSIQPHGSLRGGFTEGAGHRLFYIGKRAPQD